jgi:hypothetical protein
MIIKITAVVNAVITRKLIEQFNLVSLFEVLFEWLC